MAKALLLVHLSLLLASSFTVYGAELEAETPSSDPPHGSHHGRRHHKIHHPVAHTTPTRAPAPAPYTNHHAPAPYTNHHAPLPPPGFMPRSLVEVQGVVYCESCKFAGLDTLLGATPIVGANVKLQCYNSNNPVTVLDKTDKNGYFLIKAPQTISNYEAHMCKVFLVNSTMPSCEKPSSLHGGDTGAALTTVSFSLTKPAVALYTVGPFGFEPKCEH